MKLLLPSQISLAKKPKQPAGKHKIGSGENYENIFYRLENSFKIIQQVAEILPYIEKNQTYLYAGRILELITQKGFEPIFQAIFPTKKEIGGAIDDRINFDKSEINIEKIIFASHLLKFSGDYILQSFPKGEYDYLHPRIESLVNDLQTMVETFNKNKELQRKIEELEDHVKYFEPIGLGIHESHYDVGCLRCRGIAMGKTIKEAIEKIEHVSRCTAPKEIEESNPNSWEKWYKIQPPKQLLITWEERKKFDELKKKEDTT